MSDTDSSNGDDYTVTNVLLGYTAKDPKDDEISHLGGRPVRGLRSASHTIY